MPLLLAMMLSAAVTVTSVPAGAAPPRAKPICPVSTIELAAAQQKPRLVRLDRMPPARHLIAVLHTDGGCEKPIVVRDQVGANRR